MTRKSPLKNDSGLIFASIPILFSIIVGTWFLASQITKRPTLEEIIKYGDRNVPNSKIIKQFQEDINFHKKQISQLSTEKSRLQAENEELKKQLTEKNLPPNGGHNSDTNGKEPTTKLLAKKKDFPNENPVEIYRQANSEYNQKRYDRAIQLFEDWLKNYPNHKMASFACYWLAESYLQVHDREKAENYFWQVLEYPRPMKKDDALMSLGDFYMQESDHKQAKILYKRLIEEFPDSIFFRDARAKLNQLEN